MAVAVSIDPYRRAVESIEAVSWRGVRPGLERTRALLETFADPHAALRGVLVAGTNGKGSVCALIDSCVRAAGIHSVLLTKPHLVSFCERIIIDGAPITERAFAALIEEVVAHAAALPEELQPTGFEMLTVAGIVAASRAGAGVVVCEVGMGGRLDSTNVLDLGCAVVTNVALDHREHLGDTVSAIAHEKAAIIKAGNVVVTGAEPPALEKVQSRCREVGASLHEVHRDAIQGRTRGRQGVEVTTRFADGELTVAAPLLGAHQVLNVAIAVASSDALRARGLPLSASAVRAGCAGVRWPARMQWIEGAPALLVDAAHNPAAMSALAAALPEIANDMPVVVLFAAMRDKDVDGMLAAMHAIPRVATVVTAPRVHRAMPAAELAARAGAGAMAVEPVAAALDVARRRAGAHGLVLVCGSLYLAGEVLALLPA